MLHILILRTLFQTRLFEVIVLKFFCNFQAQEQGRPPERSSRFYAKGALQYLVPILTQTLTKQVSRKLNKVMR